jgi:thiol-disulfide isomerase/thioredoxin
MNRRELLAGAGSLGVLGAGAFVYSTAAPDEADIEPVPIETIAAPGSDAGEVSVPEQGRPTFLEVFATSCGICEGMMPTLQTVHDSVDGVQFLSVTNEPIGATIKRSDVADWWREHEGNWTVGLDSDLDLTAALDVRAVPTTVVFDEQNRIVNSDTGEKSSETVIDWIESA